MPNALRFICYGLGKVGKYASIMLLSRSGVELVGAIDLDPNMVGKDAGEVLELDRKLGVIVSDNPEEVLSTAKADVVIIATRSWMQDMHPALSLAIKYGINVVTSSTELSHIWANLPDDARKIDEAAKEAGISIIGTGCGNYFGYPFIAAMTGASEEIDEVHATMIGNYIPPRSDAAGSGRVTAHSVKEMTVEKYNKAVIEYQETGGHEGKGRSGAARAPWQLTALIADTLGWKLDAITSQAGPVTSPNPKKLGDVVIEPGGVVGIWSRMTGIMNGKAVITHYWRWQVDPEEDGYEQGYRLEVKGKPNFKVSYDWDHDQVRERPFGNKATYRAVANAVPYAVDAPKGITDYMHIPTITVLPRDLSKFGARLNVGVKEVFIPPGSPEHHPEPEK
ncbi:MAG: hypothetical protein ACW974_02340 [Candidatus Thorarchaeota archaeon]|jgi:4-hydroxy-tetrahydrodipicolinate reductase